MEIRDIIERLKKLNVILEEKDALEKSINELVSNLTYEKTKPNIKLEHFDATHLESFIKSRVGEEPISPKKGLAIIVPVYLKKKKEYENDLKEYISKSEKAEQEYYNVYKNIRQNFINTESQEREVKIREISLKLEEENEKLKKLIEIIDQEDIIGLSTKNALDVQLIIKIFEDKRADSIKEAINVLYEDKHRERMEKLMEMHVVLTKEAKEASDAAVQSAESAIQIANEALELADSAYDLAQDAYNEAQDAQREAQAAQND